MLNLIKWIWDKAEQRGENKVLSSLLRLKMYHELKSDSAYLKEKLAINSNRFMPPELSTKEHLAVVKEITSFIDIFNKHNRND